MTIINVGEGDWWLSNTPTRDLYILKDESKENFEIKIKPGDRIYIKSEHGIQFHPGSYSHLFIGRVLPQKQLTLW